MPHVTVYIAASLDGFIARANGSIDWLSSVEAPGEDYGYASFLSGVDTILMGRTTYEQVRTFGDWPYTRHCTVVFTHARDLAPRDRVVFTDASVEQVLTALDATGSKHVWLVGGGKLIQQLWQANRIDVWQISWIPILLGQGIPLFPTPGAESKLKWVETRTYPSGLVQCIYESLPAPERKDTP